MSTDTLHSSTLGAYERGGQFPADLFARLSRSLQPLGETWRIFEWVTPADRGSQPPPALREWAVDTLMMRRACKALPPGAANWQKRAVDVAKGKPFWAPGFWARHSRPGTVIELQGWAVH